MKTNLIKQAVDFNRRNMQMAMYNSGEIVKKAVGGELTVEQMYEYDGLFPMWSMGTFAVDDMCKYGDTLYRCIQAHTASNPLHTPDITPALWVVVQLEPEGDTILGWVAGEAVSKGDLRMYNGKTYECISGHTTQADWTPPAVPALWELVS